jgi:biotin-dependent carboxylase-like uncharacterized protein
VSDGAIEVVDVVPGATIQDLGRPGLAHLGVPHAGAMDAAALRLGNRLLGNPEDAAGVEVLVGGMSVRFLRATTFALTGAPAPTRLAGLAVGHAAVHRAGTGQLLAMSPPPFGLWSYLTVGGGIDAPPTLASRSTDTLSGIGPSPLRPGDLLSVGPRPRATSRCDVPALTGAARPGPRLFAEFRWGPRDDRLTTEARSLLVAQDWTVTSTTDRVAARLAGPELTFADPSELPTEAVALGSIQVTNAGTPIVHLANPPPTGGYSVVGVISVEHVPRVAQSRPGTLLRLVPINGGNT